MSTAASAGGRAMKSRPLSHSRIAAAVVGAATLTYVFWEWTARAAVKMGQVPRTLTKVRQLQLWMGQVPRVVQLLSLLQLAGRVFI